MTCFSPARFKRGLVKLFPLPALLILIFIPVTTVRADETTISGTVRGAEGGSLSGMVMIEKGRLYGKNFKYGGLIKDGRFSVRVDEGGSYGIHLYATGYVYFPLGIQVESGKDNRGQYRLPPNPAAQNAPVINKVTFADMKNHTLITLSVSDPNRDLSHQVLALNASTGEGFRMDPPGLVLPFTRTYPEGNYTLKYNSRKEIDQKNWYFVAADNKCYNSPVLGSPFSGDGVVAAKMLHERPDGGPGSPAVSGQEIFTSNCSMCHYADSDRTKVGPGLMGLYRLDRTPSLGNPVTDEVIRKQILDGGEDMPPYSHLTEGEVEAVIEYLKTL